MRLKFFLVLVFLLMINFISADFQVGEEAYDIDNTYVKGEPIRGWINISLNNVDLNATFQTNGGSSISLSDLLGLNNLLEDCEVPNCDLDYSVSNAEPVKTLNLIEDEPKLVGFKFNRNINEVEKLDFKVTSNVPQSCYNQFRLDIFNDEVIDFQNEESSGTYCAISRTKGCFDENKPTTNVKVSDTSLCQRVELPESAGFRLGAYIIGTEIESSVIMGLYSLTGLPVATCSINNVINEGEFFCDAGGSSTETKEYYVCINGNSEDNLYVPSYQTGELCGFPGIPPQNETSSYNLIAYSHQFAGIGDFFISEKTSANFLSDINSYLASRYGTLECAVKNCVIPIKITPEINQQITFEALSGEEYVTGSGTQDISTEFYDLSEIPLKYNSGFQQIYLDNTSLVVGESGILTLSLEGEEIFSQNIIINNVPLIQSISPSSTAAAVPTEFIVGTSSVANVSIVNYNWNFGNGEIKDTSTNKIIYSYNSTGTFNLVVTITDSNQLTNSKSFSVLVDTPVMAVNRSLTEKLKSLENLKSQLKDFSPFIQTSLQPILNLVEVENKLSSIKLNFNSASPGISDTYYINLMKELLEIDLPSSISVSRSAKALPFYVNQEKVDVDALALLEGDYDSSKKSDYESAIVSWSLSNLVNKLDYTEVSGDYGGALIPLVNVFELNVDNKNSAVESYFILEKIDSFKFEKDYDKREIENHIFIPLDAASKIVFSTTENFDFAELPLFISPSIDNLSISKKMLEDDGISKWFFFGLIIFFLVLVAVIAYIILQKWYAKKYENYLFKNKNDLYNLISFVEASKKKNVEDDKIIASLKKSGWSSEQLRYIIRKYLGKQTGMLEIPIEKILNFFNKKFVNSSANAAAKPTNLRRQNLPKGNNFRRR